MIERTSLGGTTTPTRVWYALLAALLFGSILAISATAVGAQARDCTVTRNGNDNVITWDPGSGTNVIRRNGDWLVTPADGVSTFTDSFAPAGASYVIRTRPSGVVNDNTCTTGTPPVPDPAPTTSCTVTRSGSNNVISWADDGGLHVLRFNGDWLATPGNGESSFIHVGGPTTGTYLVRTFAGNTSADRTCQAGGTNPVDPGPVTPDPTNNSCTVTRSGTNNVLTWSDNGGVHVIRRNSDWLATPGANAASYTDVNAAESASYQLRTFVTNQRIDTACVMTSGPNQPTGQRQFVVHISVDGLRSDFVTPAVAPNLSRLVETGAATLNARTDPAETRTLPNHTSQFTGRFAEGVNGHGITFNNDISGLTVHDAAGEYTASVFDVVHDNGGRTVFYSGKEKFELHERTWRYNGAPDVTGANNGTNKIDVFVRNDPSVSWPNFIDDLVAGSGDTFGFFQIREPDSAGHLHTWGSAGYRDGVTAGDRTIGQIIDGLEAAGVLDQTMIIVTADHGGPTGGALHDTPENPEAYTVPFVVWGAGVANGADLYALNTSSRNEPGTAQIGRGGSQPIRGHDAPNLALDLLGLPAIPDSTVNANQNLNVN